MEQQPGTNAGLAGVQDSAIGAESVAELRERKSELYECIEALGDRDREIVVLRGIEQIPNQRVAEKLGENPSTIAMRYHRAIARLREALPDSIFDELGED